MASLMISLKVCLTMSLTTLNKFRRMPSAI
jgi:hypothetical protein